MSQPEPQAARVESMTGFARVDGTNDSQSWVVELKSVNGRGLDLRTRMPPGLDAFDAAARAALTGSFKRGSINLTVSLAKAASQGLPSLRLNRDILAQAVRIAEEIEGLGGERPRLDAILSIRGVIEVAAEGDSDDAGDRDRLLAGLTASLKEAIAALAETRAEEGARLVGISTTLLDEISELVSRAGAHPALDPEALRNRLAAQVTALLETVPALSEERLAQEAALLMVKADVREEMDRLTAHVAAIRDLMAAGGAIGRRLDFLCQELNREANTLCSKSNDLELTRIGLDLKATIDQLREQVQNIE